MSRLTTFLCAAILWTGMSMAASSSSYAITQQKEESPSVLKVYPLQFVNAEAAVEIVERILQPQLAPVAGDEPEAVAEKSGIVAEPRTNSVVASGSAELHRKLASVLEVIDVASTTDIEQPTVVDTKLGGIRRNESFLQKAADLWSVQTAYDSELDLLMIKGDRVKVKLFQDMLSSLDEKSQATDHTTTIRIIWLASQSHLAGEAKPLTPELERATAKLKELGIEGLGVACQLLARSESDEFQITGSANFKDSDISLLVDGKLASANSNTYKFQLEGILDPAGEVCQLAISARLLPGKVVVLAAAPIKVDGQEVQSVFVVQLIQGL